MPLIRGVLRFTPGGLPPSSAFCPVVGVLPVRNVPVQGRTPGYSGVASGVQLLMFKIINLFKKFKMFTLIKIT
jgi:hypothetical protein